MGEMDRYNGLMQATQEKCEPDYTKLQDHKLLEALADHADRWAAAFCQIAKRHGLEVDEGWMVTWFANAIENSWTVRMERGLGDKAPALFDPMNDLDGVQEDKPHP